MTLASPGAWVEIDATDGLALIAEAEAALEPGDSPERADLLVARAHLSIHDPDPAHSIRAARDGLDMVASHGFVTPVRRAAHVLRQPPG